MSQSRVGELKTEMIALDDIIPYWRNPRRVSQEAVNAVAESIQEFQYNQPIVVDAEHVIIVGHTRYAAMRRLGVTHAEVVVADTLTPAQVKQLRIVDNRSGEYSMWDFEALQAEMDDLDSDLLLHFFPELTAIEPSLEATAEWVEEETNAGLDMVEGEVSFVCPSCFHGWTVQVTRDQIFTGIIKAE